ncbi:glycoside hydrolase family 30 protein [Pseudoclavibacter sp. CFCC 13611]|uniref:glycoside hydrolase family 30 protein n=1 Tax=Pseudoclavibacter sp. CFCC 13611 TaxID=2615178 RepID=UPI00130187FC|nr:hypothetical protein [Pseudoclavibacter sp. CFCC 13611]KAB1662797.1 hypothetical protein F8O08_09520 [Pseudoclavibacter sp. CFCC 13611]
MLPDQPPELLAARVSSGDGTRLYADATAGIAADLRWQRGAFVPDHAIVIDADSPRQRILGFGAALTDASAEVLLSMPSSHRSALLHELFATRDLSRREATALEGATQDIPTLGLTTLRLTIGSSDFSNSIYNYEPRPGAFTLQHDERRIVPLLDEIRSIQPDLRLIASPWSAPPWMKTRPTMFGRLGPGLARRTARPWLTWLGRRSRLDRRHFGDYANYLVRYCERMAELGHPVDLLTLQNEPGLAPGYPGMVMSVHDQIRLIADHLGPALAASSVHTRLLAHDHNWDAASKVLRLLGDPAAGRFLDGTAWHGYKGEPDAQSVVHRAFPKRSAHLTEITSFRDPKTLLAQPIAHDLRWHMRMIALGATRNWAESITYWNLALDGHGGPFLGPGAVPGRRHGSQMEGVVDVIASPQTNPAGNRQTTVRRNVGYYSLAHLSAVRPGARCLTSTGHETGYTLNAAFQNPDDSLVLIIASDARERRTTTIAVSGWHAELSLDPGDTVTMVISRSPRANSLQ